MLLLCFNQGDDVVWDQILVAAHTQKASRSLRVENPPPSIFPSVNATLTVVSLWTLKLWEDDKSTPAMHIGLYAYRLAILSPATWNQLRRETLAQLSQPIVVVYYIILLCGKAGSSVLFGGVICHASSYSSTIYGITRIPKSLACTHPSAFFVFVYHQDLTHQKLTSSERKLRRERFCSDPFYLGLNRHHARAPIVEKSRIYHTIASSKKLSVTRL